MDLAFTLPVALAALAIEAIAGYPDVLYRAIGHPVTWMGALIGALDRGLNRDTGSNRARMALGVAALALVIGASAGAALLVERLLPQGFAGEALLALLASSLLAQRSLDRHVGAVARALEESGLEAARTAVGRIVGRNTAVLDEAAIARAAIESLAENFSDGVVAPLFWTALAGLWGGAAYKAVNTADSMIGHRTPRHLRFGWAAARLDDLVNLPASRLAALWIGLAATLLPGASPLAAVTTVRRDARRHRSPNAGWPEAAMAGALGLALAGPRVYGDTLVEDALMGEGRRDATAHDIRRALALYRAACGMQALALAALVLLTR